MNVEIGAEATLFQEKEYISGYALQCTVTCVALSEPIVKMSFLLIQRPSLPHLTSVHAEQLLARACENEAENAKRMRLGMEPISQPPPAPLTYAGPLDSLALTAAGPLTFTQALDKTKVFTHKIIAKIIKAMRICTYVTKSRFPEKFYNFLYIFAMSEIWLLGF
jgi:hypothetical protein